MLCLRFVISALFLVTSVAGGPVVVDDVVDGSAHDDNSDSGAVTALLQQLKSRGVDADDLKRLFCKLNAAVIGAHGVNDVNKRESNPVPHGVVRRDGQVIDFRDQFTTNRAAGVAHLLYQGDIMLTKWQVDGLMEVSNENRTKRQALNIPTFHWGLAEVPNTIPYEYEPNYPEDRKAIIEKSFKFWEDNSCVRFVKRTTQTNRLYIRDQPFCNSYLGMIGGPQELNLGDGCAVMAVVTHEVAHALGIFHTQSRPDRDAYVSVDFSNIQNGQAHNFDKQNDVLLYDIPYEIGSVMHYGEYSFALDANKPVLTAAAAAFAPYQHSMAGRLPTFLDQKLIWRHYNCSKQCTNLLACENGGHRDPNDCNKCRCPLGFEGTNCQNKQQTADVIIPVNSTTPASFRHQMGVYNYPPAPKADTSSELDDYQIKTYIFRAPAGRRVKITPKVQCCSLTNTCSTMGVELKYKKDKTYSGVAICDWRVTYPGFTSEESDFIVIGYTRGFLSQIDLTYEMV